jgi:hypothetical protein
MTMKRKRATTYRHKRYDARSSLPIPSIQLAPCSAEIAQLAPGQLSYTSKRIETEALPIRNTMREGRGSDLLKSDLTETLAVEIEAAGLEDYNFIVIRVSVTTPTHTRTNSGNTTPPQQPLHLPRLLWSTSL